MTGPSGRRVKESNCVGGSLVFPKLLVVAAFFGVTAIASAGITVSVVPYYEGPLPSAGTYVYSYDLQVTVTGDDAWSVAGGVHVGTPWISVYGGTFYQAPVNDANPPNPLFFAYFPDSEFTSFYTTHLGYPNIEGTSPGVSPGFAFGPADTPTALVANWFLTPDGNNYPGTFTIARFTVIPDGPDWCGEVHVLVGSVHVAPVYFYFGPLAGCCHGDIDGDRDVDLADLAELLANYGTTSGATYRDGDLDGDDDVDLDDRAELLSLYGAEC
jgi:hypothetical protein